MGGLKSGIAGVRRPANPSLPATWGAFGLGQGSWVHHRDRCRAKPKGMPRSSRGLHESPAS